MHFSIGHIGIVIFVGLLFFTFLFMHSFNIKVNPKLIEIAKTSIQKLQNTILTNFQVKNLYSQFDLENMMVLTKNKQDEIISVDFKLEEVYKSLTEITKYLQQSMEDVIMRKQVLTYYSEELSNDLNSLILLVPMGVSSNMAYLAHLGPKIPVKITYMEYVTSNIRIALENYGINNVLISIYIDCEISSSFLIPAMEEKVKNNYSILVASKIIEGKIPTYYGGKIETKSNLLNIPIN